MKFTSGAASPDFNVKKITTAGNFNQHFAQSFQSIYERSPLGIIRSFKSGRLIVNQKFLDMLGYTQEAFSGLKREDITHPDDLLVHVEKYQKLVKGEIEYFNLTKRYLRSDNSICWSNITVTAVRNNDGVHVENLILVEDVTERRRSREAMEKHIQLLNEQAKALRKYSESNKELENFAYVASHDLKEPLRTISNFTQLLQNRLDSKLDDTDREFMEFIKGGVKNMNNLIDGLLTYSQVNTSDHMLELVHIPNLLFIIQNSLKSSIQETNATIEIKNIPETIVGDKLKIKQLFQNLIINAIKFRKPGAHPQICISSIQNENYWEFFVKDNGIGIKQEFQEKIFQLFKRLHARNEYPGCGIGLALCKRIVNQHGGTLKVDSVLNEGTTFSFTIQKNKTGNS